LKKEKDRVESRPLTTVEAFDGLVRNGASTDDALDVINDGLIQVVDRTPDEFVAGCRSAGGEIELVHIQGQGSSDQIICTIQISDGLCLAGRYYLEDESENWAGHTGDC